MKITNYKFPEPIRKSKDYRVRVRQLGTETFEELGVYTATVTFNSYSTIDDTEPTYGNDEMAYCAFSSDFKSPIEVEVINNSGFGDTVKIRPIKANIPVIYEENRAYFVITKPQKLSIEFDEDFVHNIFLFAEAEEKNIPDIKGENVIYYSPGVYDAETITLKSNQTLYLAEGAYVYGVVSATDVENITICGRGTLCGEKTVHTQGVRRQILLNMRNCKNVTVRDVTLIDGAVWTIGFFNCNDIIIDNVKEITCNVNSDGLDLVGCSNVRVENCFFRNYDDCVSIKSFGADNRNIKFKNIIFWNDCAHTMLVGPESDINKNCIFEDISFENITVLYSMEYNINFMGVIALMCANNAIFRNITFKNIEVERLPYGKLISVAYSKEFAKTYGHHIENITIENVNYRGFMPTKSTVMGIDSEHRADNIIIRNVRYNGRPITEKSTVIETNEFAKVIFE